MIANAGVAAVASTIFVRIALGHLVRNGLQCFCESHSVRKLMGQGIGVQHFLLVLLKFQPFFGESLVSSHSSALHGACTVGSMYSF